MRVIFRREGSPAAAPPTDEALAHAYLGGDAASFEQLMRRYERPVYLFCLRFLGNPAAAEDATQEIFFRVVKGLSGWDGRSSVKTWTYTIARNHCVDAIRKRRHRKTESLDRTSDPEEVPPVERVASPAGSRPDRQQEQALLRQVIAEGLAELPEAQREVFVLREYAGAPFREIAEMTEVSENTVKSRMRYALESLRRRLEAAGFGKGGEE